MRLSNLVVLGLLAMLAACATDESGRIRVSKVPRGSESAIRTHDALADDFEKSGNDTQAAYHREQANNARRHAVCSIKGCKF